jgi:surface polysaccharide O-acyltransferase-like enzyme
MSRIVSDLLRCLAVLAVVATHATDAWRAVPGYPTGIGAWAVVAFDQAGRFCVPLFVLLSGHALAKRYADGCSARDFLARRASRIGVPYLAWSGLDLAIAIAAITWPWRHAAGWGAVGEAAGAALRAATYAAPDAPLGPTVVRWLLTGAADYHLYFLPIIGACYLLFPLLRRWRCNPIAVALVIALQVGMLAWQEATRLAPGLPRPPAWSVLPLYWVGYFQAGIWLASHDAALAAAVRRWPAWSIAVLVASGPALVLADLAWMTGRGIPGESAGGFDRPAIAWHAAVVVLAALRWGHRLDLRPPGSPLVTAILTVAAASFATYLSHPWVLRGLAWICGGSAAGAEKPLDRPLWVVTATLASLVVGAALQRAGQRWRVAGWFAG